MFDFVSYLLGKSNQDAPYQPVYEGLEYETGIWTPTEDTVHGSIAFVNTHSKRPTFAYVFADEDSYDSTLGASFVFSFIAFEDFGNPLYENEENFDYALKRSMSRTTEAMYFTGAGDKKIRFSYTEAPENPTNDYQNYYVTNTEIKPYTLDTASWKANTNYRWIAIWL